MKQEVLSITLSELDRVKKDFITEKKENESSLKKWDFTPNLDFITHLEKQAYSPGRIRKYKILLRRIGKLGYDPKLITEKDVEDFFFRLMDDVKKNNLSDETALDYWRMFKISTLFYHPGLESNFKKYKIKLKPKIIQILTEEEVKVMINASESFRNKVLIELLYESGMRVGELINIKKEDVTFDDNGALIMINGKTGTRTVRVIGCSNDLKQLLNKNPEPFNVTKRFIYKILGKLKKRVGIEKRICPKTFRHSRATHLAGYLNEPEMRIYFGWSKDSKTPSTYVHMCGRDVDKKMIDLNNHEEENISKRLERIEEKLDKFIERLGGDKIE